MSSLLFGIILSALLSTTSFLIVLLRVSPLTAPFSAIPAFFVSLFLCVATLGCLALLGIWKLVPLHTWDEGKLLSISLRQGIFLASSAVIVLLFHLLGLLTWWITLMIAAVFVLIELAFEH